MNTSVDHNSQAKGKTEGKSKQSWFLFSSLRLLQLEGGKTMASEVLLKRRLQNLWRQTDILPAKCVKIGLETHTTFSLFYSYGSRGKHRNE